MKKMLKQEVKMETWLSIWSIGQESTLDDFKILQKAGFDGVEIWAEHLRAKETFEYARQTGLRTSIHLPFHDLNIATPDTIIYERAFHVLNEWMDILAGYGGSHAVLHGGYAWSSEERDETLCRVQSRLMKLNEAAQKRGIVLLLENLIPDRLNYCHHVASSLEEWTGLLQACNLKACLDTGHLAIMGNELEETVKQLGELLGEIHVSENDGKADLHLLPGEGNHYTEKLIDILTKYQFTGPVVFEINPYQYTLKNIVDNMAKFREKQK